MTTYEIRLVCKECKSRDRFIVRVASDGHVGAECAICHWWIPLVCPDEGLCFDPEKAMKAARLKQFKVIKGRKRG